MSKLLIDEYPLIVLPTLAQIIGLGESIVLQQIHYWLSIFQKANDRKHFRKDRWWVYNSVKQWQDNFPFWSGRVIRHYLDVLRQDFCPKDKMRGKHTEADKRLPRAPLLLTDNFNPAAYDRTLWYTIDYDELGRLEEAFSQCPPFDQHGQMELTTTVNSFDQHGQMELTTTVNPIPETTQRLPETTSDAPPISGPPPSEPELAIHEEGSLPVQGKTTADRLARLRQKFGADPLSLAAHCAATRHAAGVPEDVASRPRGWQTEDISDAEFQVCQRVADLWANGSMAGIPRFVDPQVEAAGEVLRLFEGDVSRALETITLYHEQYETDWQRTGRPPFSVVGPQSLVNVLRTFEAEAGYEAEAPPRAERFLF